MKHGTKDQVSVEAEVNETRKSKLTDTKKKPLSALIFYN